MQPQDEAGAALRDAVTRWEDLTGPLTKSNWKVVEQTVCANNVERFHGTVREESYGDVFIEVTGAPAPESIAGLSEASINFPKPRKMATAKSS